MASFNLNRFNKIAASTGNDFYFGDTGISEKLWDQMSSDYDPHGRRKKHPGQMHPNRNQYGDKDTEYGSQRGLGPGPNDGGVEPDIGFDATEQIEKWFGDMDDLRDAQLQTNSDDVSTKPFFSDGSQQSYPIEGTGQQAQSPLSYAHDIANREEAKRDAGDSDKRLPNGFNFRTHKQKAKKDPLPKAAFNISKKIKIFPYVVNYLSK